MRRKKRILVLSPPFSGHLEALKALIRQYGREHEFHLLITGWTNISADTGGLPCTNLAHRPLAETDPALWTLPRAADLLGPCIRHARSLRPDLIIYDFFSIEGLLAGRALGIPAYCSIPALVGPYTRRSYLKTKLRMPGNVHALRRLREEHGVVPEERDFEMISDGIHLPGDRNLVWSYAALTPRGFLRGRHAKPYSFVGVLRGRIRRAPRRAAKKVTIYLSFGTVVMDNLWNRQPQTRAALKEFIARLAALWEGADLRVIFVTQGKRVLDVYPANWEVHDRVDQPTVLDRIDVFITHGGSNSFHEAATRRIPMVVIPFFGDQPLVASVAQRLGIGISLSSDKGIDTRKRRSFLGPRLAGRVDRAVRRLLGDPTVARRYAKLRFDSESIGRILR